MNNYSSQWDGITAAVVIGNQFVDFVWCNQPQVSQVPIRYNRYEYSSTTYTLTSTYGNIACPSLEICNNF